jgi:hypothetical protein
LLTPQVIVPTLLVPLIGYSFYRRFRSHFGRQTVQHSRLVTRLLILAFVVVMFGSTALHSAPALEAVAGGLLAGMALGMLGVHLTRFESDEKGIYYTPNSYIGAAVTLLLVGRLVYRMVLMYSTPQLAPPSGGDPFAAMTRSPLTLATLMLTMGYYLMYSAGILYKSRGVATTGTSKQESNAPPV